MRRRGSFLRPALPAALAVAAAVSPALADPLNANAAAAADELFHKAGKAYDAGDFVQALSLYQQAFAFKKTHDIAAMMAQTELKLGKPCEAAAHLAYAVSSFPPSLTDERRARVERAHADVKKQIGSLRVETTPADAKVQIDFQTVPAAALPGPFCVAAGERVVVMSRDGFSVERRTVVVEPGTTAQLSAELRRVGPAPAATADPPGAAPTASERPVSIATPLAFSGLVAGLGSVITGAVLLSLVKDQRSEADSLNARIAQNSQCSGKSDTAVECRRLNWVRENEIWLTNAGAAAVVGGAVLTVVAGSFLSFRPSNAGQRPGGPQVSVGVAPDGASIALKGAF